jgi:hypothetical protein
MIPREKYLTALADIANLNGRILLTGGPSIVTEDNQNFSLAALKKPCRLHELDVTVRTAIDAGRPREAVD